MKCAAVFLIAKEIEAVIGDGRNDTVFQYGINQTKIDLSSGIAISYHIFSSRIK